MQLIDRIGIDIGIKQSVEDGLRWAATHGLHYVDFRLDTSPEAFVCFSADFFFQAEDGIRDVAVTGVQTCALPISGLSWQQGPLSGASVGRFLTPEPLPERLLFVEPLRRRLRVKLADEWIADSEDVLLLHEPGRYLVAARLVEQERSEEHTSELQSRLHLVCRLLLEKKKNTNAKTP